MTITAERRSRSTEAFFGRRRGKRLHRRHIDALEAALPHYRVGLDTPPPARLEQLFKTPVDSVRMEIGFGAGEHLLCEARRFPAVGFIGVEPFVNGMARLMLDLNDTPMGNIRVHDDDATQVLDWLPDSSLAEIDLLYPDPWPKKRHWKRRFVGRANLDRFARVLKPGGLFRFASDIDTYVNWTLLHCRGHEAFEWQARSSQDWRQPYEGWEGTRYEAKAIREGRPLAWLTFICK